MFEDGRNIVIKDNRIEITDPSVLRLPDAKAIHTARIENLTLEGNEVEVGRDRRARRTTEGTLKDMKNGCL